VLCLMLANIGSSFREQVFAGQLDAEAPDIKTTIVNMSRSPNFTVANSFMTSAVGAQWAKMPVGIPSRHEPLLPMGVVQEPTLLRIDERFDFAGVAGSTYIIWGLGPFITFKGQFLSRHFGHNRIRAKVNGNEVFQIAKSKHRFNPFKLRYSYRVLAPKPGLKSRGVKYTINKDLIGRGFLGIKQEWRIYQGHERMGKMVYYCVGAWFRLWRWKTRCWHSKLEYESGRSSLTISGIPGPKIAPCAVLSQIPNVGLISEWVPDQYYLFVHAGEDASLLLAFGVLVDSTNDEINRS
jgi:hypothetical protein